MPVLVIRLQSAPGSTLGRLLADVAIGATRTRSTRSRSILPLTSTRRFASSFVRMRRWTCLR